MSSQRTVQEFAFRADTATSSEWWRNAVVYQVYLRSFADGNGDGIGDLAGLRTRLPYLAALGVDALWLTPHYPSGGADGGYDVTDYRAVDPQYGDVADVKALVDDAHHLGLKVLLDIVPNHTSHLHPWFQKALADPDSSEARRYLFAEGSRRPPNNWQSLFGGSAWSKTPDGRWYLHMFSAAQPDLNWRNPIVRMDFEKTLRFWLDLGVDGFRVDVAYGLIKDQFMRDNPGGGGGYTPSLFGHGDEQRYSWNQPEVHDIWREWRKICDSYPGERMLVGEVSLADMRQTAMYSRPDELHQSFVFRLLKSKWNATEFAGAIETALEAFRRVGAPVSWVLGNHDKTRQVTRFGGGKRGEYRARAAAMLMLALPGSAYLYAGEELGLPEAEVPDEAKKDPIFLRTRGARAGRDGCRVPIPWHDTPDVGFSTVEPTDDPWLPVPEDWGRYAVALQAQSSLSTLAMYQRALKLREQNPALGAGEATVTVFGDLLRLEVRNADQTVYCWMNMGEETALIPYASDGEILLISDIRVAPTGDTIVLPRDAAVWVTAPETDPLLG